MVISLKEPFIYRGYSKFLLNMTFISSSEVENIYITRVAKPRINIFHFTRETKDIFNKNI